MFSPPPSRTAVLVILLLSLLTCDLTPVSADSSSAYTSIITAPPNGITSIPASLVTDVSTPSTSARSSDGSAAASLLYTSTLVAQSTAALGPVITETNPEISSTIDYDILSTSSVASGPARSSSAMAMSSVLSASTVSPGSKSSLSSLPSATATTASGPSSNSASQISAGSSSSSRRTTILVAVIVSVAGILVIVFLVLAMVHYQRRLQRKRLSSGTDHSLADAEAAGAEKPAPSGSAFPPPKAPRPKDKKPQEKMEVIREESLDPAMAGPSRLGRSSSRNKTLPPPPPPPVPPPPPAMQRNTLPPQTFGARSRRNASIDSTTADRNRNAVIMNYSVESLIEGEVEVDSIGIAR
ncbi:hypothetical protein V1517DRAFT_325526 [Lipomyces orientalis]|uniref:Uncharacterized protein n=1 Tax=Lipomyces orientalis TaxID=1233043 RepID=A0ACC3TL79_9ASCO